MAENDKPKRHHNAASFRYESDMPLYAVVQALRSLDRPYWFMIIPDMQLEEGAAGYRFRFRHRIASRMTSEIDVHIWESDAGTTIIEGVYRKQRWTLSFLFLTTLIFGGLAIVASLVSLFISSPSTTPSLFTLLGLFNLASLCATFFYALQYDTAYHVVRALQRLEEQQNSKVKSYPRLQDADDTPESQESQTFSDYEDDQAHEQRR